MTLVYVATDYVQPGDRILLSEVEGPVEVRSIVWETGNYFEPDTEITVSGPAGVRTVTVPMGSAIAKEIR